MDINIRMGGGGGSNGRQSKLSAKHTSNNAIQSIQQANNNSAKSSFNVGGSISSAVKVASGNVGSLTSVASKVPVVGLLLGGLRVANALFNWGANIGESITGESMIFGNYKAEALTVSTLGLNVVAGGIKNATRIEPRIRRENDMKDYGRELYFNASEKNKLI